MNSKYIEGKTTKEYTCTACGIVFEGAWSDEEAMKEANQLWGERLGAKPDVVCDNCFQRRIVKIN